MSHSCDRDTLLLHFQYQLPQLCGSNALVCRKVVHWHKSCHSVIDAQKFWIRHSSCDETIVLRRWLILMLHRVSGGCCNIHLAVASLQSRVSRVCSREFAVVCCVCISFFVRHRDEPSRGRPALDPYSSTDTTPCWQWRPPPFACRRRQQVHCLEPMSPLAVWSMSMRWTPTCNVLLSRYHTSQLARVCACRLLFFFSNDSLQTTCTTLGSRSVVRDER